MVILKKKSIYFCHSHYLPSFPSRCLSRNCLDKVLCKMLKKNLSIQANMEYTTTYTFVNTCLPIYIHMKYK